MPGGKQSAESEKDPGDFDNQIVDCLDGIQMEQRQEPPKEFFTTYSDLKVCFPMFLLYLFIILVVKASFAIHTY